MATWHVRAHTVIEVVAPCVYCAEEVVDSMKGGVAQTSATDVPTHYPIVSMVVDDDTLYQGGDNKPCERHIQEHNLFEEIEL